MGENVRVRIQRQFWMLLKKPSKISGGVDTLGRPFEIFTGRNARVIVNPQTGQIISVNPLNKGGVR